MSDTKHTPQPWRKHTTTGPVVVEAWGKQENQGVSIAHFHGPAREANADLFMQAPGLKAENERLTAHTPLPWTKEERPALGGIQMLRVGGALPGQVIATFYGPDLEANADLFMRAPELQAEIERLTAEIEALKAAQPFPVRL